MFFEKRLKELEETKNLLIMQSDVQRGLLQLETSILQDRLSEVRSLGSHLVAYKYLSIAGASIAGVLAIRYWRDLSKWTPAVLKAWKWIKQYIDK